MRGVPRRLLMCRVPRGMVKDGFATNVDDWTVVPMPPTPLLPTWLKILFPLLPGLSPAAPAASSAALRLPQIHCSHLLCGCLPHSYLPPPRCLHSVCFSSGRRSSLFFIPHTTTRSRARSLHPRLAARPRGEICCCFCCATSSFFFCSRQSASLPFPNPPFYCYIFFSLCICFSLIQNAVNLLLSRFS